MQKHTFLNHLTTLGSNPVIIVSKAIGTPAALVPVLDRFRKSHASTTGSEDSSLNSNQAVQTKLPEFVAMGEPDVMLHVDTETFQFPLNC